MRDYSELEKRLRERAPYYEEWARDIRKMNGHSVDANHSDATARDIAEAAEAIAELTKRCETERQQAHILLGFAAALIRDVRRWPLDDEMRNAVATLDAKIDTYFRDHLQRQLPRDPLPDNPANGDENAPGDAVKRGFD